MSMTHKDVEDIYPLSPMQEGMLFHALYAPESGVYVEQTSWEVEGELDAEAMRLAWELIVNRHSALRSAFVWDNLKQPLQVVRRRVHLPMRQLDWSGMTEAELQAKFRLLLEEDRKSGFNLAQAPLMRLTLIRLGSQRHILSWCHHHLILDGWCMPIIIREIIESYTALSSGRDPRLGPVRPYRDYIAWLQKQDLSAAEHFWRKELQDFRNPTPLSIPAPGPGEDGGENSYRTAAITLTRQHTADLQQVCRQSRFTISTLVQGAWAMLLSRYCGEEEVVFGVTVSGRPPEIPGGEQMVGLFINTLPVRVRVVPGESAFDLFRKLQALQGELRQFEYSSLTRIQEWSKWPRGIPLFESIVVFENYPADFLGLQQSHGLRFREYHSFERTNYPITLVSAPGEEIRVLAAYEADRFSSAAIHRMLGHLQKIFEQVAQDPTTSADRIDLLSDEEKKIVLGNCASIEESPFSLSIHEMISLQARSTPDADAIICRDRRVSYGELERRSNGLAGFLRKMGVGEESIVAVSIEHSPEMIISLLGILKAGAAYLPVDGSLPPDRIAGMLQDARAELLLFPGAPLKSLVGLRLPVLSLSSAWDMAAIVDPNADLFSLCGDNLAYVLFTSGSTGRPKGVAVTHRGLANHAAEMRKTWELQSFDRVLQFLSLSFDAAGEEIYPTLISGGAIIVDPEMNQLTAGDLMELCNRHGATILHLPVSYWMQLVDEIAEGRAGLPPQLRIAAVGGEALPAEKCRQWVEIAGNRIRLFNLYGPTETTITAALFECGAEAGAVIRSSTPIGCPIGNVQAYVLDRHMNPAPAGITGELWIGGKGVARGYHHRPDLTAERFVPDPFSSGPGSRLYKTGDQARYLPDGSLEFVGRLDDQVKIRGFRIELGEIAARLMEHPVVRESAVIVLPDSSGEQRILAYIAGRKGEVFPSCSDFQDYLRRTLPEHMIPSEFVILPELPKTAGGKIDRTALPAPPATEEGEVERRSPPHTPTEEILVNIWAGILGTQKVCRSDNFFSLGGHSLRATQLASRVRDAFGIDMPLRAIFENPVLQDQARLIENMKSGGSPDSGPGPIAVNRGQDLPLSFAQQRLWFLDQLQPGATFYSIPAAFRLRGEFDIAAWRVAVKEIVRRHEILRTTFSNRGGRPVQIIAPESAPEIPLVDLSGAAPETRENELRRMLQEESRFSFDLQRGPLFRMSLIRCSALEHVILLNIHHIISDGWSVGILIEELVKSYEAVREGKSAPLPSLPIQYADYAVWHRGWLEGPLLERQIEYWKKQLEGIPPIIELPTDHPRPAVMSFRASRQTALFPSDLVRDVHELERKEGVTTFMILLAAFQTLLHRYTAQRDIVVGSPVAGRRHSDVERLIGLFVNNLVFRTRFSPKDTFKKVLASVRETALGAYSHQDVPFERLVEELQPARDLSCAPVFQVMFVLQNAPLALDLPEGLSVEKIEIDTASGSFDLTIEIQETGNGFAVQMEYNQDLFEAETIARMLKHFQILLAALVKNPAQKTSSAPLLEHAELERQLVHWNRTEGEYARGLCAHQLFERWAANQPDTTALTYSDSPGDHEYALSYSELNRNSNRLARYLRRLGLRREGLVGICMERSFEMITGMMAVLKAGGAFVPLDPAYPRERICYMIEDSGLNLLLTRSASGLPHGAKEVALDDARLSIEAEDDSNLATGCTPEQLAYVIYTSGSTGKPKGTMLAHDGMCNLAAVHALAFDMAPGKRVLQFSSLSFDAFVWEFVMALLNGAALCLTSRDTAADATVLAKWMALNRITTATFPPSMLAMLPEELLPDLETVIAAGEHCTSDIAARWGRGRKFFNAYGPTETTVCASMHLCSGEYPQGLPIGRPLQNFDLYILDENLQPVPVGVPGELHIGGAGLARGYLGKPDLTAEKFIPHPFSRERGACLYKSGDVCRYLPDGSIQMLGRVDLQVKVRGFRIELGEIESALSDCAGIKQAAVDVREDKPGDKRIVAYVVPEAGSMPDAADLRSRLRLRLPEYMIPAHFVSLASMPLTPSNKIDRRALPAPDTESLRGEQLYVAPCSETEIRLAAIASELLNVAQIGIRDSFFDLGGHSLLATQFVSRMREDLEVELPLRMIFEKPTIEELALEVESLRMKANDAQLPKIKPVARTAVRLKISR